MSRAGDRIHFIIRAAGAAVALAALVAGSHAASAQAEGTAPPGIDRPADALDFLVGEWEGTGWALGPNGRRGEFAVSESIRSRAGGHGVTFEGRGTAAIGPNGETRTVHDAFALIWAEPDGGYGMRTVVMQGHTLEVVPEISENRIVWGFEAGPMGETRYTSTVTDGVWHEVGERRMPGETDWTVFLEMTLERTAAP
ncbi:hypothetical protein [Hyphobacterium marinum]|uniref:DUF1579 domain-containing protein n=1 Tax=Hyphobacterium marinum TaxID=3116574 RepID=A0ABU7LW86_9PROT|nr:hypothetical protein [Hyphobacterium sp. Y6023]MEE2565741.1 hypothetical protein [Hyphobacterium sp. Y6023]